MTQISDLERKLTRARMILHEQRERANTAETERDELVGRGIQGVTPKTVEGEGTII